MKIKISKTLITMFITLTISACGISNDDSDYYNNCTYEYPCELKTMDIVNSNTIYLGGYLDETCYVYLSSVDNSTIVKLDDYNNNWEMIDSNEDIHNKTVYQYDIDLDSYYILTLKSIHDDNISIIVSCNQ